MKREMVFVLLVSIVLSGCSLPSFLQSPEQQALGTAVAKTLQAFTPPAILATPVPSATVAGAGGVGSIAGGIYGYPKSKIPSLTVVAFSVDSSFWYYFITQPGNTSYSIDILPAGTYHVVAYDDDGNSGGYTSGGALVDVSVEVGKSSPADINDWSGSFPPNPVP